MLEFDHAKIDYRYLSNVVNLGRFALTRLGTPFVALQLAPDYRLCPSRVSVSRVLPYRTWLIRWRYR